MRIADVQDLLRQLCSAAGSRRAFANAHGLNVDYVYQVLSGRRPPSAKLCKVLGIKPDGMRWVKR